MSQDYQNSGMVIALAVVFSVLPCVFVALRLRARHIKRAQLLADDYLILLSTIFCIGCITVPTLIMAIGANLGNHIPLTPSGMPNPPTYLFNVTLRVLQTVHTFPIMFAKLSFLFFYKRIFRGRVFTIVIWTTAAIVIVWGVSFFFSTLFDCVPIDASLILPPGAPGVQCINETANFWGLSISDVIVDLIILCIPFPFVWELQMSTKHKFGVSAMFFLGFLTILASVARLVCFISAGKLLAEMDPDVTYYVAPTAYWVLIECSLAIVSSCLPVLRPIFHGMSLGSMISSFRARVTLRSAGTELSQKRTHGTGSSERDGSSLASLNDKSGGIITTHAKANSWELRESEQAPRLSPMAIHVQRGWTREESVV